MPDIVEPLVLDLIEWVARSPRPYSEVIETWRTSCPRLTVWEDAVDKGYVTRQSVDGGGLMVAATGAGLKLLADNGRTVATKGAPGDRAAPSRQRV